MFNLTEITNPILNVKNKNNEIYGLEWNSKLKSFNRLFEAKGKKSSDFDNIAPWSNIRRCTLSDDGEVIAYYGQPSFVEDGTNGQVMVEITKFYYKVEKNGDIRRWYVCNNEEEGFKVHPAFVRNGEVIDKIFISAYEGCVYSKEQSKYLLENEQVANFETDLLSSIVGAFPCDGTTQNLTISNSRKLAQNRGEGWGIQDIMTTSAIQLLMIIEFGDFDIQKYISWGISGSNPILKTGQTSTKGNTSTSEQEQETLSKRGIDSISYRGIENFYGNTWSFVDGINIRRDNSMYIADYNFEENKFEGNYRPIGFKKPVEFGDILDVGYDETNDFLFLPFVLHHGNATPNRVFYSCSMCLKISFEAMAIFGGCNKNTELEAGAFCIAMQDIYTHKDATIGARLTYFKHNGDNYEKGTIIDYFEGTGNLNKSFKTGLTGISIKNDGDDSVTFEINGIKRTLYKGESYVGTLKPFYTINITTNSSYRVEVSK